MRARARNENEINRQRMATAFARKLSCPMLDQNASTRGTIWKELHSQQSLFASFASSPTAMYLTRPTSTYSWSLSSRILAVFVFRAYRRSKADVLPSRQRTRLQNDSRADNPILGNTQTCLELRNRQSVAVPLAALFYVIGQPTAAVVNG